MSKINENKAVMINFFPDKFSTKSPLLKKLTQETEINELLWNLMLYFLKKNADVLAFDISERLMHLLLPRDPSLLPPRDPNVIECIGDKINIEKSPSD